MMAIPAFDQAIQAWERLLGQENVRQGTEDLDGASTATFATRPRVLAILRPETRQAVQDIVGIANTYRVPIYPISTGKNWGYGSRVPARDGVIVDLGRLNRIVDFSEQLAYVTIEPGVTQRQLFAFLRDRKSGLWMDATGASPDCSIIGNTMERGFGHTPMGDHCSNACGLEIVLGNGETVETGFSRFSGSLAAALSRWGVGPSIDGLFSQSRLGIVTRMTVWLMPAPERFEAFFFVCEDDHGLAAIIDGLRPLRMDGTLRSVMHIGNDYKVLSATSQYPWRETMGRTPLGVDAIGAMRARMGVGAWNGSGGLYGTKAQVREAKRLVRSALQGKVQRLQFINDRLLGLVGRAAGPIGLVMRRDLRQTLKVLAPVYNLMKGEPTGAPLTSAYWRKKSPPPADMDPDRDGCGLLWCAPVVPNVGGHAQAVAALTADVLLGHGFEPQMSMSLATERTLICVITISFDRHVPGEDERALACYRVLNERLLAGGYHPYRWSVLSSQFQPPAGAFERTLHAVQAALDPNGILAPGRYEPAAELGGVSPANDR